MTNYERIKAMTVEDMAVLLVEICITKEEEFAKKLKEAGIRFTEIRPTKELRYTIMEKWLESEDQTDESTK